MRRGGRTATLARMSSSLDGQLLSERELADLRSRLMRRYPSVNDPVRIEGAIGAAILAFAGARVKNFLPILVERSAAQRLNSTPA